MNVTEQSQLRPARLLRHWVESDSYDRAVFHRLKADAPSLQAVEQSGGKLLRTLTPFCSIFSPCCSR